MAAVPSRPDFVGSLDRELEIGGCITPKDDTIRHVIWINIEKWKILWYVMNDEEVVDGLYQNLEDVENFEICEIFKP